ncbi:hypothetical protein EG347_07170 [Chryseobacterium sp. G0186]|uniref:hypothetical protein n=1 Tax=Chryseobacterium sp. G0186 TaxID=2487064 RepID=UPI000F4FA9F3|nr:hypothetical protein [Chryseobacterium sp. G0186]AZA77301.1 hypothetical protein EG347_07170 [Chryseobacterium sp. G0186]
MKFIFSFFCYFLFLNAFAQQQPQYIPFKFNGETGVMHTSGKEYKEPGLSNYYLMDDFRSYILSKNDGTDVVMDAVSGKELFSGNLDTDCGPLKVGNDTYHHFQFEETSALLAPGKGAIFLPKRYEKIEPNSNSWDNENLNGKQLIWALKNDNTYDILDAKNNFEAAKEPSSFESFDLVFRTNNDAPPSLVGFVVGKKTAIKREFGQQYNIPSSDETVNAYDLNFKKIGSTPYQENSISKMFNTKIQLRGSMIAPPGVKNQPIQPSGKTIALNKEFSLIPSKDDPDKLILVNTQKGSKPVLGNDKFDYRYISTSKNLKALLQLRHADSGSFFYFDFDGTYFPKGIPMIPEKYRSWK